MRFIAMKAKSSEEKGMWGKVWKKPGALFRESSPSGVTRDTRNSSRLKLWQVVYQGSSLETQCPRLLLRVGRINPFCLVCMKLRDSQKQTNFFSQHKLYSLHVQAQRVIKIRSGMVQPLMKPKFLRASQGPTSQARFPKGTFLRLSLAAIFWQEKKRN